MCDVGVVRVNDNDGVFFFFFFFFLYFCPFLFFGFCGAGVLLSFFFPPSFFFSLSFLLSSYDNVFQWLLNEGQGHG